MTSKTTYILGLNEGIVATACLLANGVVVACASEERFTRQKNQAGLPFKAIRYCLNAARIEAAQLAAVATSTATMPPFFLDFNGARAASRRWFEVAVAVDRWLIQRRNQVLKELEQNLYDWFAPRVGSQLVHRRTQVLARYLGILEDRIIPFDHHLSHAAAALWASPFPSQGKEVLVLTCDGEGDGLSATVSTYRQGRFRRLGATHLADSLGHFYAAVTEYLGMRPHDHEYKVMGLAPYAAPADCQEALERLRGLLTLRSNLTFKAAVHMRACLPYLIRQLKGLRFDAVAAAAQQLTEELLLAWAQRAVADTGIQTVAVGGGVFMNVKANMRLASSSAIRQLFVMPSAGDESTALGAATLAYHRLHPQAAIEPIDDLYWGPDLSSDEVRRVADAAAKEGYLVREPPSMAQALAELLTQGHVVARVVGRMEWGARALGHRSLLASAAAPGIVETLNRAIKQRDFWMPFAPVILDTACPLYLASPDPAKVNAAHMMVTFQATERAKHDLAGGLHPYDKTLRAQCLAARWDTEYYSLVQQFGAKTSHYGLINTSYNLHGEPIVCSADDAFSTFRRSGVNHLALGSSLISKPAAGGPLHAS